MENKLKLKHIAPYLPYNLKCVFHTNYNGGTNTIQEITGIGDSYGTYRNTCYQCIDISFTQIKPILFPLDCLTKEIEVNGERFVPIEKLEIEGFKMSLNDFGITLHNDNDYSFGYAIDVYNNIIIKLLSWKFDIFGLIEKGLAFPVTEEFNPYK